MTMSTVWSMVAVFTLTTFVSSFESKNDSIKKVHLIMMNHLDVGYDGILPKIGFINNILNTYFTQYFPRAVRLSDDMHEGGYVENFVYTTHPWLVSLYVDCPPNMVLSGVKLECPSSEALANFTRAIKRGDITWHAGPMNMQPELMTPSLFEYGIDLSLSLDRKFNITRKFRTLSQRDVPGLTQTAIPLLVKKGVAAVSVGVNPMTSPPAVPDIFLWKYGKDEVIATWHKGGYPDEPGPNPAHPGQMRRKDCVIIPNFSEALCYAFRTDNWGPPNNVEEILSYYEILRAEFPGADLKASTFEEYMAVVSPIKSQLPVISKEIGDTWILGVASDPRKMAEYKTVSRMIDSCLSSGVCDYSDERVANASRFLLKMPEHTWGLPSVNDNVNWTNTQFYKASRESNYQNCGQAWLEQREMSRLVIDALGDHQVAVEITEALAELKPYQPDLTGYRQVKDVTKAVHCPGSVTLGLSLDGSITTFMDGSKGNLSWASDENPLAKFEYITYNQTDFTKLDKHYNYNGYSAGFYKRNVTIYAHPESRKWPVTLRELYQRTDGECELYAHLEMVERRSWIWYGAPRDIWVKIAGRERGLDIELQLFTKTSTRLPEAIMFTFKPKQQGSNYQYKLSKLGNLVDPNNVVLNGSQYQHIVDDSGVYYATSTVDSGGLQVSSLDVPLVCPFTDRVAPTVFPTNLQPVTDNFTGVSYNIYNNIWDTNYILWYPFIKEDQDFKARFAIDLL